MQFPLMFALTGTVQGWVLWWLWRSYEHKVWPATEPMLLTGLLYAALAVPLVIYCTQNVARLPAGVRRGAVVLYALLYGALGAYTAWGAGVTGVSTGLRFADGLAAVVLGFVSLGLLCGFDVEARRWRYEQLFHYAWRNGILLFTAWVMVGIVWAVLFAGAGLMSLIGVKWVMEMIRKPVFFFPVTGLVAAGAFALGLARAGMTETIRRYTLSIAAWLLPLVLFFAVLWVLALPFTGLEPLFKTRSAAFLMLAFTALAVLFANCAYQDGEQAQPYPQWLSRATQAAWLALLAVVAIAWWALGQRVAQHGWSEDRLWAALVAGLAAVYAAGYALSWLRRERWMRAMAPTNITAALLLCAGLLAFLSPLAQVRQLAVQLHLVHVQAREGQQEPDWDYLRWESGRFGRAALQAMAAGQGVPAGQAWAQQATRLLAQTRRYDSQPEKSMSAEDVARQFDVHPRGRSLPPGFVAQVQGKEPGWEVRRCLKATQPCPVWLGDLNGDGQDELLLFHGGWNGAVFLPAAAGWRQAGSFATRGARGALDPAALDAAQAVAPQWQDLQVQGQRLRLQVTPDAAQPSAAPR